MSAKQPEQAAEEDVDVPCCLVIIQRDHRKICRTVHFHDFPVPRPDSMIFQAWKMVIFQFQDFVDLYKPGHCLQCHFTGRTSAQAFSTESFSMVEALSL